MNRKKIRIFQDQRFIVLLVIIALTMIFMALSTGFRRYSTDHGRR